MESGRGRDIFEPAELDSRRPLGAPARPFWPFGARVFLAHCHLIHLEPLLRLAGSALLRRRVQDRGVVLGRDRLQDCFTRDVRRAAGADDRMGWRLATQLTPLMRSISVHWRSAKRYSRLFLTY